MNRKVGGLGKGLDALLNPSKHQVNGSFDISRTDELVDETIGVRQIDIDGLMPNPNQPRKLFEAGALNQLAESIQTQGVIQPILVRNVADRMEIIAGERRWRAAQQAGLARVPVIVRNDLDEQTVLAVSLIENLQREALNVIEEAEAFQRLLREFKLTHDEIAKIISSSRSKVTNTLRLLELDRSVQSKVKSGELMMGHVRPLIGLEPSLQKTIADRIITNQWSAREVERQIKTLNESNHAKSPEAVQPSFSLEEIVKFERLISELLQHSVTITQKTSGQSELKATFKNSDQLKAVIAKHRHKA